MVPNVLLYMYPYCTNCKNKLYRWSIVQNSAFLILGHYIWLFYVYIHNDENVHRYAKRGGIKDKEIEREEESWEERLRERKWVRERDWERESECEREREREKVSERERERKRKERNMIDKQRERDSQ